MRLKEIRKNKGLSVPQLSELSSVPVRTIEDLEKRDDGRVSTLIKLADALNVTLDELCRDKEKDLEWFRVFYLDIIYVLILIHYS